MTSHLARGFAARHPLFSKKESATGIWWESSAYYLWWEYLRRHEGYRRTCLKGGKGQFAKLYSDFGDVHATSFKEWWTEGQRGARLFAEPLAPTAVTALSDEEARQLIDQGRDDSTLLVAIPLTYGRRQIAKALNKLLDQHHSGRRGIKSVTKSNALYPLNHAPDAYALKVTLDCYDLKRANPKMPLWQIAQEVGVSRSLTAAELREGGQAAYDKKLSMTSGVSRKLRHAAAIIDGVGRGVFPAR